MCYSGIEPDPFHVEVQQWQSRGQQGQPWMLSAFASSLCPSSPISSNCRGEASFKEDRKFWVVCNILASQVRILISHEIGLEGIEINISNTRLESSSSSQLFDPNGVAGNWHFYEHVVD